MHAASVMRMCHYGTVKGILYSALVWCSLHRMHDAVLIQLVIKLTLEHHCCLSDQEGNGPWLFTPLISSHTLSHTLCFDQLASQVCFLPWITPRSLSLDQINNHSMLAWEIFCLNLTIIQEFSCVYGRHSEAKQTCYINLTHWLSTALHILKGKKNKNKTSIKSIFIQS